MLAKAKGDGAVVVVVVTISTNIIKLLLGRIWPYYCLFHAKCVINSNSMDLYGALSIQNSDP